MLLVTYKWHMHKQTCECMTVQPHASGQVDTAQSQMRYGCKICNAPRSAGHAPVRGDFLKGDFKVTS